MYIKKKKGKVHESAQFSYLDVLFCLICTLLILKIHLTRSQPYLQFGNFPITVLQAGSLDKKGSTFLLMLV